MSAAPRQVSTLSDIATLRKRARQHVESGAVVEGYLANREATVKLLNGALATEIVCSLRYLRHYYMAQGIASKGVAAEFLEHAKQEQEHAHRIAERITQLNGEPDLNPATLVERSHAEYVPGRTLVEMIREDLVAERIAIESYTEMIAWVGDNDPVTRRLLEEILATEQEHATDMADLLGSQAGK